MMRLYCVLLKSSARINTTVKMSREYCEKYDARTTTGWKLLLLLLLLLLMILFRSDIFITLWGVEPCNLVELLGLKKGSWVSVRNFRANSFRGSTGISFVQGRTLLLQRDEASVDDSIKLALNEDWDARKNTKKLFVVGQVVGIEQIHTFKVRGEKEGG